MILNVKGFVILISWFGGGVVLFFMLPIFSPISCNNNWIVYIQLFTEYLILLEKVRQESVQKKASFGGQFKSSEVLRV